MTTKKPVDPVSDSKLALSGRVVCLDAAFTVLPQGTVYADKGRIVAVQALSAPPPAGFEEVKSVDTGGTLYPGLMELHNHLSYDALRLWNVPQKYTNRDQWSKNNEEYKQLITGPMKVVGQTHALLPALVRYVESKCLVAGVTTSQGIELASSAGIRRFYKGVIRTVEQTGDANLPPAATRIPDVVAKDKQKFLAELKKKKCLLLHLSEGTDDKARAHFQALQIKGTQWAITDALAGIHCAALKREDFAILVKHGGSMVWSPLSNLLLYGATADVKAAKAEGALMAIGSDWSPSGSKNLLGELKVAQIYSKENKDLFTDREIVSMATRNAAAILKWDKALGSLEAGKYADILVIAGNKGDPYAALIAAKEMSIQLVMIHGMPRYGEPALMKRLGATGDRVRVGGVVKAMHLDQEEEDPDVAKISLADAKTKLAAALKKLPQLAREAKRESLSVNQRQPGGAEVWSLALDELEDTGVEMRPRLPLPGQQELTGAERVAVAPVPVTLKPLKLDPLTVADDGDFLDEIAKEKNLPPYLGRELKKIYD